MKDQFDHMEKPKTTKQHLLDKLTLGKLPLYKRHQKMSQYGPKGEPDQLLENAVASWEFDTSHCTNLSEHCQLRAQHFLAMANKFIEQLDNELHQEVAKHVLNKYLAENAKYIDMQYKPERLTNDIEEKYGTLENYIAALLGNYRQVTLENRVSKMFSAIPERVHSGSRTSVTDVQFNRLCKNVDNAVYSWQNEKNGIYLSCVGITPEELSELHSILRKIALNDALLYKVATKAERWIDEAQAKYNPDVRFYNSYFNEIIKRRLTDVNDVETDIDEFIKRLNEKKTDDSENTRTIEECIEIAIYRDESKSLNPDTYETPDEIEEREQEKKYLGKWKESLTPKQERILALYYSGASRTQIAQAIDNESPESSKGSGKAKPFKAPHVQYALKKIEDSLEQFLRSNGYMGRDEMFPGLTRKYQSSGTSDNTASTNEEESNE